ncbi:NAD(P)-dependent oxidoreductase [Paenibacillus ginsengarvi]|uniref:SDR family oxidoreductase n=1 Tax=Paenibacillus ginsengarvi TaxID=400777 RepID=A0A3B0CGU7_9BACL|nr:SDR family oxidoreductase [Paenibacillus ginsengarvi]RKN84380.1 SDR family oxidoreductase [Paenibacillus ginsengarvi]
MKLIVFGASGGTGRQAVVQALEQGHEVTAVVRKPENFDVRPGALEVIRGDVLLPATFRQALHGKDAVLSALGVSHKNPTTVYSEGTSSIMEAMQSAGVLRLICLSSAGLDIASDTPLLQRMVIRLVIQRMYKHAYADMARMEAAIRTSSGINWTVIRPPRLTNGPRTKAYRTAIGKPLPGAEGISRADLADYMIRSIADRAAYGQIVEISKTNDKRARTYE